MLPAADALLPAGLGNLVLASTPVFVHSRGGGTRWAMAEDKGEDKSRKRREHIRSLFTNLPDGYGLQVEELRQLRNLFHEEMAKSLQPGLDQFLAKAKGQAVTPGQRDAFAEHLTHDLQMLGLAVKSPSSPEDSRLSVVEVTKRGAPFVRYRLESLTKGPRQSDPTFDEVPPLQLTHLRARPTTLRLVLNASEKGGGRGR